MQSPGRFTLELAPLDPTWSHGLGGCLRGLAWIPVFSLIDNTTAFAGGDRLNHRERVRPRQGAGSPCALPQFRGSPA